MPCYTPLDAYEILGEHNQKTNGKKTIEFKRPQQNAYKEIQLPCGQCIGCKLLRSVTWASRIMHELQCPAIPEIEPNIGCFITLTYDEENLPDDHSLNHDHFQRFLKRLRHAIKPKKIRFFMCGEYGDDSWRPHYHAIIFGYDFTQGITYKKNHYPRRQQIQMSEVGNPYFISKFLTHLWGYSKNDPIIAPLTWESAAYVARYCTKKITGDKAEQHYNRLIIDWNEFTGEIFEFKEAQLLPEYATMSRRPGIGKAWYEQFKDDCYPSNYLIHDGHKTPIPKYYDKLLEMEDEIEFKAIKMARELALIHMKDELKPDRLKQRHKAKMAQYNTLRRNKI
jgi:hypothetical protein